MASYLRRLSPSISNFQLCPGGELSLIQLDDGLQPQQTCRYDSFINVTLELQDGGPTFHVLLRVNPSSVVKTDMGESKLEDVVFCDVRVRQLGFADKDKDNDQKIRGQSFKHLVDDDAMMGYQIENMLALKSLYKYARDNGDNVQVRLLKSSAIRSMKVTVIFDDLCHIPERNSMSWILLPQKIGDILSTYDLHVKSNTLVDLRQCPLAGTSSIAFLFVRSCTMKNTTDENVIGRVGRSTKIAVEDGHDKSYYLRQIMGTRVQQNQNIFESTNSNIYSRLRDLVELQLKMKEEVNSNRESKIWRGILLAGPTGCGKNMLVQELSRRLAINLIQFNMAGELLSSPNAPIDHDTGCDKLESIFNRAIQSSKKYPTILLLQQLQVLDLGGSASSRSANTRMKLIVHLCRLFDKISSISTSCPLLLTVIGTTGQPHLVCTQLRMFGRFEQEIYMSLPTEGERLEIVKFLTMGMPEFRKLDLGLVARATPGYTRAELAKLVHAVRIKCGCENRDDHFPGVVEITDIEQCVKNIHPAAMKGFLVDTPNVKWEDIGGQKDLKLKLKQSIEWPLKHEEAFKRLGIAPPRGILMYGPPGCSKTMIAKALASECSLNFFSVNGSELFSQFVGDSEKAVRSLFREARQVSPCLIFFDEIDSIVGERGSSSKGASSVHERVIAQLLVEIDGVEALKGVTIVAATNRPDMIDPALLRPGRLDRIVYVPLPDEDTRRDIFKIHFRKMPVSAGVDVNKLVELTKMYSGAEVAAVCHEAAMKSLEENVDAHEVHSNHFLEALREILAGTTPKQVEFYENYGKNLSS